jgi:hypothetical protein
MEFVQCCVAGDIATARSMLLNEACVPIAPDIIHAGFTGACAHGYVQIVLSLILEFKKFTLEDGLIYACKFGHIELVRILIQNGATINAFMLSNACTYDAVEIVKLLLHHIDDANCCLSHVIYHACQAGALNILKYILSKYVRFLGDWTNHMHAACGRDQYAVITYLIKRQYVIQWTRYNMQDILNTKPKILRICLDNHAIGFDTLTIPQAISLRTLGLPAAWFENGLKHMKLDVRLVLECYLELDAVRPAMIELCTKLPPVLASIIATYSI